MFRRKKNEGIEKLSYDPGKQKPVLKCSICNGEQVAGLKDLRSGQFEEVMLVSLKSTIVAVLYIASNMNLRSRRRIGRYFAGDVFHSGRKPLFLHQS